MLLIEKQIQCLQASWKNNATGILEHTALLLVAEDHMARGQYHVDQLNTKHNLLLITCTKQQEANLEMEIKLVHANEQLVENMTMQGA